MNRLSIRTRLTEIFLLFLFSLPALSPLFSSTPTRSADGLLHLYRLVQLDALWRNEIFFSRWLPDLAYGYGMPLFNYYAPLVYYLTTPLHSIGISFPLALNLSLAAALFLGAVGMFYFSRALCGTILETRDSPNNKFIFLGALLAALAYLYAPYVLFNALLRANLAEQWALAFAPFALWRFFVLVQKPNALNWALAVLFFAAVMLSHNVTSFLFAPLLFLFVGASLISGTALDGIGVRERPLRPEEISRFSLFISRFSLFVSRFSFLIPLSALLAALALSAFFWLPALVERDFVQITRVIVTPDFDYRFNFVPPAELISFLPRADAGRLNPTFPSTLGLIQIFLAAVGIIFLLVRFRSRRALPFFALALAAFGFILLMLSVSQPIWDSISLLSFVQLPMRLRGLVALCLAPLVGIFIFALPTRWRTVSACIAIAAIVLSALPLLYPRYARDVPLNPTLSDMFAYEQRTGAFGTTSFGEYLPVWVQNVPDKSPFDEAYARNEIPNRFVIPESATVCGAQLQSLSQTICVNANDSWHAIFRAFYFPGWVARVQGNVVPITPTPRTGLITFEVPRSGIISVAYEGTNVEHIAEWISIASAIFVFGMLVFGMIRQREPSLSNSEFRISEFIPLLFLALALITFKAFYVDRVSNPLLAHFDGARVEGVSQTRQLRFGDEIELLGFGASATELKRGETLRTTLYLRALPALKQNLSTFVHLTAPDGFVLAQKDNLHPANLPTTEWDLDAYAVDAHAFEIPAALAPGEYELRAGVYDPQTNTRLQTSDGVDFILLQKIRVQ